MFDLTKNFVIESEPWETYAMNLPKKRIQNRCNDNEAIQQSIYKILNTERYEYEIYSWSYGVEFKDLIGGDIPYVVSEVKERIRGALLQDDRIKAIENFEVTILKKDAILVIFQAVTEQGNIKIEREVNL